MHNPILTDMLELLTRSPAGTSEFALHRALADHPAFIKLGDCGKLALFRKHFLVRNALYQLQQQLWTESRQALRISPLHIQLGAGGDESASDKLVASDSIAAYYLDWNNYRQTCEAGVEALLDSFWVRYGRQENRQAAIKTLDLELDATAGEIESRYRKLVSIHHPDKGGDMEHFIAIRSAYEQLR